MNLTLKLAHDD